MIAVLLSFRWLWIQYLCIDVDQCVTLLFVECPRQLVIAHLVNYFECDRYLGKDNDQSRRSVGGDIPITRVGMLLSSVKLSLISNSLSSTTFCKMSPYFPISLMFVGYKEAELILINKIINGHNYLLLRYLLWLYRYKWTVSLLSRCEATGHSKSSS